MPSLPPRSPTQSVWVASFSPVAMASFSSVADSRQQVDAGDRAGVTTDAAAEIKKLKRENAELRRANEILKAASAFFAAELDRPHLR